MTKIDIISGFLGAGKTTLINKLIKDAYKGEKLVLIENEFGEIGVDGGFLKDAGIEISEINSGCICCSLVGDFSEALSKVKADFNPDRILIEPSGVGKLSDVIKAVKSAKLTDCVLNSASVIVDVNKCKMYMKNFGEFFNDQISTAGCIIFSHTDKTTENKLAEALSLVREKNPSATVITTPYSKLDVNDILKAMEKRESLESSLKELLNEDACPICGHHHDHEHHHGHEHHHDHEHHHGHEHHHHADDVFTSWGRETVKKYSELEISDILSKFDTSEDYGIILRAKGMVEAPDGEWVYFDYVPDESNVRGGAPASIGKICVIGAKLNEDAIATLFGL